jgi:hypothetical protein
MLAFLIPLLLAFVLAFGLRLALGAERALRYVGLAVPIAFLIAWLFIGRPGWHAYDPTGRLAHIVLGATLLGLALDFFALPRMVMLGASAVFFAVCAWAELFGGIFSGHVPHASELLALVLAVAIAVGALWRVDVLRRRELAHLGATHATLIQLMMMAFSLAAVALASNTAPLHVAGVSLAFALLGFLACVWIMRLEAFVLPHVIMLASLTCVLAIAWAIGAQAPRTLPGIALTGLILFADGTADRVPLPKAGISRILYPLILAGMSLAPIALAAIVTVALHAR